MRQYEIRKRLDEVYKIELVKRVKVSTVMDPYQNVISNICPLGVSFAALIIS